MVAAGLETLNSVWCFHLGMSGTSHIIVCSKKIGTCVIGFEKGQSGIRGYLHTQPILNNSLLPVPGNPSWYLLYSGTPNTDGTLQHECLSFVRTTSLSPLSVLILFLYEPALLQTAWCRLSQEVLLDYSSLYSPLISEVGSFLRSVVPRMLAASSPLILQLEPTQ